MSRPRETTSLVIATLLVVVVLFFWNSREPRYGGFSLSEWLGDASRSFPSSGEYLAARDAAIRAMGPRAVPDLVKMLAARETPLAGTIREIRNHFFRSRLPSVWELRTRATTGLQILGPASAAAVPEIVRLLHQEPQRLELWFLLRDLGPASAAAAPLLQRSFPNMDQDGAGTWGGDDFHPWWLISDLFISWGTTGQGSIRDSLRAKTNSILHRVSCLWALRRDAEYARRLLPILVPIIADPSEPKLLRTAALHAIGRIPRLSAHGLEKALQDYESNFGSLPLDSIQNGSFAASDWSGTNQPPNDPPAPSPIYGHWLTWNGVVGRNLPGIGTLKIELGPRKPPGAISQVFRTTPGASYNLRFEAATGRNLNIQITAGDLNTNCMAQSSDLTKPTFLSFSFHTDSPVTTLTFATTELNGYGPFIDNISVSRQ